MSNTVDPEVEQVWQEFWAPRVTSNGVLDPEQVKRELFDYHHLLQEVPQVYDYITSGRISKPNTYASEVIGQAQECLQRDIDEAVKEALDDSGLTKTELRMAAQSMFAQAHECSYLQDPDEWTNHTRGCNGEDNALFDLIDRLPIPEGGA